MSNATQVGRSAYQPLSWHESSYRLAQAGLSPSAWCEFLDKLLTEQMPMHSIMLSKQGQLLAEAHATEVDPMEPHRLFSVSKSVTALAIGCLAEEHKLRLSDKLLDFYPEYQSDAHPWLQELTIEHMLKMETCHAKTTYKINPDNPWVESFFVSEPDHAPGKIFSYDSSSSHVLAHLSERISGQSMLDYLRKRGLDEVGFSKEAYFLTDPQGSPLGGSGLMASVFDFRLIAELVCQGGGGVFPEAFCRQATTKLIETIHQATFPEERYGYGYMFWRHRAGWACYGMGGQLAIFIPERDLLFVTTADLQKSKALLQRLYDLFFDMIKQDREILSDQVPPILNLPKPLTKSVKRAAIIAKAENPAMEVDFSYNEIEKGLLQVNLNGETLQLPFTCDEQRECHLIPTGHRTFVSATWLSENQLYIVGQIIDQEVGSIEAMLTFSPEDLTLCLKNNVETGYGIWQGLWTLPIEGDL